MKQLELKYADDYIGLKPVVKINNNMKVLIDTGADRNLWMGRIWKFNALNASKIGNSEVDVAGISGDSVRAETYLFDFSIGDFKWCNVHILKPKRYSRKEPFDLILGMSTFVDFVIAINAYDRKVIFINKNDSYLCKDYIVDEARKNGADGTAICNILSVNRSIDL